MGSDRRWYVSLRAHFQSAEFRRLPYSILILLENARLTAQSWRLAVRRSESGRCDARGR